MKNFNKKLTLLTILSLGASIAQPSGIFNAAKSTLSNIITKHLKPQPHTVLQRKISQDFASLIEDANKQVNLHRLPERVSDLAYDHTKTVEAFRVKAERDAHQNTKYRHYFDIMIAATTGITLGYAGSEFVKKDTQSESQKAMSKQRAEKLRLQRTFAVLSKSSHHTN